MLFLHTLHCLPKSHGVISSLLLELLTFWCPQFTRSHCVSLFFRLSVCPFRSARKRQIYGDKFYFCLHFTCNFLILSKLYYNLLVKYQRRSIRFPQQARDFRATTFPFNSWTSFESAVRLQGALSVANRTMRGAQPTGFVRCACVSGWVSERVRKGLGFLLNGDSQGDRG